MTYKVLAFLITASGFIGCTIFVTRYWVLSGGRWKDTEAGKFLIAVYVNLGLLFLLIMVNTVFGDWPGRKVVTLALYMAYVAQTWWPIRLLNKAQRRVKRAQRRVK